MSRFARKVTGTAQTGLAPAVHRVAEEGEETRLVCNPRVVVTFGKGWIELTDAGEDECSNCRRIWDRRTGG